MNEFEKEWARNRIVREEIDKYLNADGSDYVRDDRIIELLKDTSEPDPAQVRAIIRKALAIQTLSQDELAVLIRVKDPGLWEEMKAAAGRIKHTVYDNRIVTFAPLYLANKCVNNCVYCGFRESNGQQQRRVLTQDEVRKEAEAMAGQLGHKRLIVVYGEHPESGVDYIAETIRTVYSVNVKTRRGTGQIRRV
ncbi:MAG: [Kiritimatiellae bacterium]|nr:[FeFe] hydrogenase H-cluster radical SAM maturase HydG [Kiritimatiellia bacterium]